MSLSTECGTTHCRFPHLGRALPTGRSIVSGRRSMRAGARSTRSIFDRIVGTGRGEEFAKLCTATIRAVAQGVLGVAFIQAIVYIWVSGDYATVPAVILQRAAVRRRHARQRAETADAGSRGRCAHARDPARRVGWHGEQRHPWDVRWRDLAGTRLSDLHGVGGCQPRQRGGGISDWVRPEPTMDARCWVSIFRVIAMPSCDSVAKLLEPALRLPQRPARSSFGFEPDVTD